MKIQLILGSTRNERIGENVAKWVFEFSKKYLALKDIEIEFLDLAEWNLPMYQEPFTKEVEAWAEKIAEADGFIFVTPEYNHSYPAVLKNALDYVGDGWVRKPVGLVGYSDGMSAGIRAVENLKLVAVRLQMAPINRALYFPGADQGFDDQGNYKDPKGMSRLEKFLDELVWWTEALKVAREKTKN